MDNNPNLTQAAGIIIPPDAERIAVVQPLPGIGDMTWHLPHIRAIARFVRRPIILVAKPRSAAGELFSGETIIQDVVWLDRNPEQGRGRHDGIAGFVRLTEELRRRRFDAAILLHHSRMLAAALFAGGIPRRYGYGFGWQRRLLNRGPFLSGPQLAMHPYEQATAWLAAAGIPQEPEPRLAITAAARALSRRRLGHAAAPFVAIGIATSEPYKQWGEGRFAALAAALLDSGWPLLVIIGGPAEATLADAIRERLGGRADRMHIALGWNLAELAGLLAEAEFYVGNDTGAMNLAAAVGTRSYGLFGARQPFDHSSAIVPILPPGGRSDIATGMVRITTEAVLDIIRADQGSIGPPRGASKLYFRAMISHSSQQPVLSDGRRNRAHSTARDLRR